MHLATDTEFRVVRAILDSKEFTIYIPDRRIKKALDTLKLLQELTWVPVRKVASFVGQIISMGIVIGSVSQIMTRSLSIDILKARNWNSYIKLADESKLQMEFWERNLGMLNKRTLSTSNKCSKLVYSDANNTGFAGFEVSTLNGVSNGMWSVEEAANLPHGGNYVEYIRFSLP